jgi:hypothetical protein
MNSIRRIIATVVLTCSLACTAFAGDMPIGGNCAPATPTPTPSATSTAPNSGATTATGAGTVTDALIAVAVTIMSIV